MSSKIKKTSAIKDFKVLRAEKRLNQSEFWGRLGVTQSAGSRYESGRFAPKPVVVLAHLIYVQNIDIDARNFK